MLPSCFPGGRARSRLLLAILPPLLLTACAGPSLVSRPRAVMQEAIEGYLGTPYQWGGSSPAGIDCSGLVMRVYQRVGIDLPRNTNGQRRWGRSVGFQDLQFGDVLFFRGQAGGEGGKSLHAGIFLGGGRFVHASKSRGVIVDDLDEGYWLGLFLEGRRFLE